MASTRHLGQSRPQSGAAGAAADDAAGRQWVVAIGIHEYLHWPRLANVVADAKGVQRLFTEKLGFAAVREPLLDAEAAAAALTALARDELPQLLKPVDSLLLFFAGHGQTRRTQVGTKTVETGYLVPAPARRDQFGDLLPIDTFLRDLSKLPAQHVLVLIDAWHSGFALGQAVDRTRGSAEYRNDIASRLSRKVITSAMVTRRPSTAARWPDTRSSPERSSKASTGAVPTSTATAWSPPASLGCICSSRSARLHRSATSTTARTRRASPAR